MNRIAILRRSPPLLALLGAFLVPALLLAQAPSTRPGMGPILYEGGTAFRVWAPNATSVAVAGEFNNWSTTSHPLANEGNGHWSRDVPGAQMGQRYKYVLQHNGNTLWRADPRSTDLVNSVGDSIIGWLQYDWQHEFTMPPWNELVLYEMHLGTFNDTDGGGTNTSVGSFQEAESRLDHLRDLGVNMILLMPIAEFAGDFSWGYNPAWPFAVESAYGTPWDLKHFVDQAHARGIGVMFDVVHNHYGPSDIGYWCFDGPCLGKGGIYFYTDHRANTQWGDTRPDYGRPEVRDFIVDNAMWWLNEFRGSGLRWDSTSNIWATSNGGGDQLEDGRNLLRRANDTVDGAAPWKYIMAEDFHGGDWITQSTGSGGLGFDGQWSGDFVHTLRPIAINGDDNSRDMNALAGALRQRYNGNPWQRVIYTESHDEVANGKARVPEEIFPDDPDSWWSRKRSTLAAVHTFTAPGLPMLFQGQELLEDEYFRDDDPLDWTKATTYSGILRLYQDIIRLRRNWHNNTRGLRGPNINTFHVNNGAKVIAYHRWDQGGVGDDVVVIANWSATPFEQYNLGFPRAGEWHVLFNSDSNLYSPDYGNFGPVAITAGGNGMDGLPVSGTVSLAPYSALVLSQQPNPGPQPEVTGSSWTFF